MVQQCMNFYKLVNKYKNSLISICCIAIVLLGANTAFFKDVVYESDDYFLHATRTANYYLAIKQGQFPVRWGPNLNQSYGYPAFNYMYHTPYFAGAVLHSFGLSVQQSLNTVVLLTLILGGISAYVFIRSYLQSESWSILLSVFFISNPYTLLNVYWRGAIGELLFYAVVPLFLLAVKKKHIVGIAVTTAFLILSHLPSMILLAGLSFIYVFVEFKNNYTNKTIVSIFGGGLLGILLSSWYWIPAIFEQWMIRYELGASLNQYVTQFISLPGLFDIRKHFSSSALFTNVLSLGSVNILALLLIPYLSKKSKTVIFWFILIASSLFLLTPLSAGIWDLAKLLQYVQYPWRFLWVINIASIMIFITLAAQKEISLLTKKMFFVLILFGVIFSAQKFIITKKSITRSNFDWYHPATSTGSSFNEHDPIWSNIPYYLPEELSYVLATQSAAITDKNKTNLVQKLSDLNPQIIRFDGRVITYTVTPHQEVIVLYKRLFYPGWEAYLDKKKVDFVTDIPEYTGILAVKLPAETESHVSVVFTGYTQTRKFSEILSSITLFGIILYYLLKKLWQNS